MLQWYFIFSNDGDDSDDGDCDGDDDVLHFGFVLYLAVPFKCQTLQLLRAKEYKN